MRRPESLKLNIYFFIIIQRRLRLEIHSIQKKDEYKNLTYTGTPRRVKVLNPRRSPTSNSMV